MSLPFESKQITYGEYSNLEIIYRFIFNEDFNSESDSYIDVIEIYDKESDNPDENILYKFHDSEKNDIEKQIIKLIEDDFEYDNINTDNGELE